MIKLPETFQEIFDTIAIAALKQNKRSVDSRDHCRYRHNGLKCFIGFIIPDEAYDPSMEGKTFETLVDLKIIENKFLNELENFQLMHDLIDACEWEKAFRDFAELNNVSTNKMDQFLCESTREQQQSPKSS